MNIHTNRLKFLMESLWAFLVLMKTKGWLLEAE